MFSSSFREGMSGARIPLPGATSASAFRALLTYLYTDSIDLSNMDFADSMEVMKLTDQYGIPRLYQLSKRYCLQHLSIGNAIQLLSLSDTYGLADIRMATFAFTVRNFKTIKR